LLHACNAVDGTASKVYPSTSSNVRFTCLLRENYAILGPMGAPGVDLQETRFPVMVRAPKAPGGQPDLADIIYGIHRCHHGHGEELPQGFELLQNVAGRPRFTEMEVETGRVRLSDRVIFGLLAVAVMSLVNVDQKIPDSYRLSYGNEVMPINGWWGRAVDFPAIAARDPVPVIKLDFGDWMDPDLGFTALRCRGSNGRPLRYRGDARRRDARRCRANESA
jgi:hypothetical protein